MPDKKHHVFSARTTEEGLRMLNELKKEKDIAWDELVIDAVCAHYGLDRAVMELPKQARPDKAKPKGGTAGEAKGKQKGEADGKDGRRQQNGRKSTIQA
jgi:hypothetical protein